MIPALVIAAICLCPGTVAAVSSDSRVISNLAASHQAQLISLIDSNIGKSHSELAHILRTRVERFFQHTWMVLVFNPAPYEPYAVDCCHCKYFKTLLGRFNRTVYIGRGLPLHHPEFSFLQANQHLSNDTLECRGEDRDGGGAVSMEVCKNSTVWLSKLAGFKTCHHVSLVAAVRSDSGVVGSATHAAYLIETGYHWELGRAEPVLDQYLILLA